MSRSRMIVAALVAAAVILPALAAFHVWRPAPSPRPAASVSASPISNGTDAAWLKLMIAMNDSTMTLLARATPRVTDPGLATFLTTLAASHRAELGIMNGIVERRGIALTNEHEGHELPGIVTPADLTRIEAATGTAFDAAVRECLREHLEQGARLAGSEQRAGQDPETMRFAGDVERTRQADLTRM